MVSLYTSSDFEFLQKTNGIKCSELWNEISLLNILRLKIWNCSKMLRNFVIQKVTKNEEKKNKKKVDKSQPSVPANVDLTCVQIIQTKNKNIPDCIRSLCRMRCRCPTKCTSRRDSQVRQWHPRKRIQLLVWNFWWTEAWRNRNIEGCSTNRR